MAIKQLEEAAGLLEVVVKKFSKHNGNDADRKMDNSILPVYYLIGECYIKMAKVKKAKDFLIAAYWSSLKSTANDNKENAAVLEEDALTSLYRHRAFCLLFKTEVC